MKSLFPRVALTSLALGVCASGYAQDPVPIEFYRPLKNSVSIGVRRIGGDAKVKFSGIGRIPSVTIPDLLSTTNSRGYDNGIVYADGKSTYEINNTDTDNNGTLDAYRDVSEPVTSTATNGDTLSTVTTFSRLDVAGGRFRQMRNVTVRNTTTNTLVSSTDTILQEFLNYNDGATRNWAYNQPGQTNSTNGTVDMSIYSVAPSGSVAEAESDGSAGVELQFAHVIKRYKRFEWGINFSAGASEINAKTRKRIGANLITTTDRYSLLPGSSFENYAYFDSSTHNDTVTVDTGLLDTTGAPITYDYLAEKNHLLSRNAQRILDGAITPNGANVDGYWQVKGAYYMLRLGPVVRVPIAKKWTVSASAGGALAFVGSRFIVDEYIDLPDVVGPIRFQGEGDEKAMVGGYYADVNIERWLTVRTGFFAGYSVEKMGTFTHEFAGRKAEVDLGTSGGFRFGIITRF